MAGELLASEFELDYEVLNPPADPIAKRLARQISIAADKEEILNGKLVKLQMREKSGGVVFVWGILRGIAGMVNDPATERSTVVTKGNPKPKACVEFHEEETKPLDQVARERGHAQRLALALLSSTVPEDVQYGISRSRPWLGLGLCGSCGTILSAARSARSEVLCLKVISPAKPGTEAYMHNLAPLAEAPAHRC